MIGITEDSTKPDHRALLAGLLASVMFHALFLAWWSAHQGAATSVGREAQSSSRVRIELRRFAPTSKAREMNPPIRILDNPGGDSENGVTSEPTAPVERSRSPIANPQPQDRPRELDLRLPAGGDETFERTHDSGNTVFDPRLAARLQDLQSRRDGRTPGYQPGTGLRESSRMYGGRWTTEVRLGKLCFEVIEADPLDEFSREQWYAVECSN